MVLPLYLAMNASEMSYSPAPDRCAWMACHFSSYGNGITNIPESLPAGSILILNDRMPCQGHSAGLAAAQLKEAVEQLECESVLLDFQRSGNLETEAVVQALLETLPCPVAVSESYAAALSCPVFIGPNPLHIPLETHLAPWKDRDIWLEAALCQETAAVTKNGAEFVPQFPPEGLDGGYFDETLCCNYITKICENTIEFTLFDTPESLEKKLALARSLGVKRAVGLYQELGGFR